MSKNQDIPLSNLMTMISLKYTVIEYYGQYDNAISEYEKYCLILSQFPKELTNQAKIKYDNLILENSTKKQHIIEFYSHVALTGEPPSIEHPHLKKLMSKVSISVRDLESQEHSKNKKILR